MCVDEQFCLYDAGTSVAASYKHDDGEAARTGHFYRRWSAVESSSAGFVTTTAYH